MALLRTSSSQIPCPYCFIDLDLKRIAYRCSGKSAAGRVECVPYGDPARNEVLGDAAPVLPPVLVRTPDGRHILDDRGHPELHLGKFGGTTQCTRCGGNAATSICPNCHSFLPEELSAGAVSIGVVGARNSGKTVWLSLLEKELTLRLPGRWPVSIDHPGGTVGLASDLVGFQEQLETDHRLPDQTAAVGSRKRAPSVYRWKWVDKSISGGSARVISVYDTAGEDIANRDTAVTQHHLTAATAIVLVIDPFSLSENRDKARARGIDPGPELRQNDVLDGLTSILRTAELARGARPGAKLSTPIAVAVTKLDAFRDEFDAHSPLMSHGDEAPAFDEEMSETIHEHLKSQLVAWGGGSLVNKLDSEYAAYRLFGVSALGAEPDYHSGAFRQTPSPSRVADPLLWILRRQNFIPARSKG